MSVRTTRLDDDAASRNASEQVYGNIGIKDTELINARLSELGKGAVVVNLGCGPSLDHLHALASAVGRREFDSTLVFADLATAQIEGFWAPRPREIKVVQLNAANATSVLGREQADLVLAFGLFGALSAATTSEATGARAWPTVLRECLDLLKPSGLLLGSNSCGRQPPVERR